MNFSLILESPFTEIILKVIIVLIIALILIKFLRYLIEFISKEFDIEATIKYLLKDLVKYLTYIFSIIIILEMVGIDVTAIFVSLGIIGVTIGFAARDVISSFMSGIFILADKTIKVGEIVEINDIKGQVEKVGFRTTTIITKEELLVTIPNSAISKNPYINYDILNNHEINLKILVPIEIDLHIFEQELENITSKLKWVLDNPKPKIIINEINEFGILLSVYIWVDDESKIDKYHLNLTNEFRKIITKKEYYNKMPLNKF